MREDSFQDRLYSFADRHAGLGLPPWTAAAPEATSGPLQEGEEDERYVVLGMRRSLVPPLGDQDWELEPKFVREVDFYAASYRLDCGTKVALIRIPRYDHDRAKSDFFGGLIRKFESSTDALLIDQQYNPGGSLLQMYSLCSYLTNQPLPVPLHQVKLWPNDLPEAEDIIDRHSYGAQLPEEDRPNCYDITWAEFVIEHAKLGEGATSDPIPLFGISKIEPAKHSYTKPIFLLSNEKTLSAGEFLAAIMKDSGRALLIGNNTAGAGGCVRTLDWNGALQMRISLTWTVGWRRNGFAIENTGVSPDIQISADRDVDGNNTSSFTPRIPFVIQQALHEPKGVSVIPQLRDSILRDKPFIVGGFRGLRQQV